MNPVFIRSLFLVLLLLAVVTLVLGTCAPAYVSGAEAILSNSDSRSPNTVRAFRHLHPCPDGPDKGSRTRCHGYVIDHLKPLCFGGKDVVENMQYQTVEDGLKKDEFEREACALARRCK